MMFRKGNVKFAVYLLVCITLYGIAVISYASWNYEKQRKFILNEIDEKLLIAARSVPFLLAADFHDRALSRDSITFSEEMANRLRINAFAKSNGFPYVYTLVKNDSGYYFSAPTVTDEEARERKSWYFYPYRDIPEKFREAYATGNTVFTSYTDQWGTFRSVALPQVSPAGHRYLSCVDMKISHIQGLYRKSLIDSILTAVFFLLCSIPFIAVFHITFRSYTSQLKRINAELTDHRNNLQNEVEKRTDELTKANEQLTGELRERKVIEEALQEEKGKLEHALANIKTLSGLIPICSSCKKIRDDRGYWNQIESYIRDHSDAVFTHGICPDCEEKLYSRLEKKTVK